MALHTRVEERFQKEDWEHNGRHGSGDHVMLYDIIAIALYSSSQVEDLSGKYRAREMHLLHTVTLPANYSLKSLASFVAMYHVHSTRFAVVCFLLHP